jgi:conserved domain protein
MRGDISMSENTRKWFRAAGRRAVKTVAQTFIATVGTAAVMGEVNWPMVASASVLAGILSMATSIAGLPELDTKTDA